MIELIPQPKQILEHGGALRAADLVLRFGDADVETAAFGPDAADPAAVFVECCEELLKFPSPGTRRTGQAVDEPDGGVHYSPAVPEVYDFFEELFEEIYEVFGGDTIHLGCDEVDLTMPGLRSAAMVEELGAAAVYVGHVQKVAERARKYWSRILFFCEFADGRYNLPLRGSMDDVRSLHDAGLSFVNWNYYDHRWEDYFHFINSLNRCGVDQIIAPGVWTWRQLFPDYFETRRTLPLFTQIGFREGVRDSITCAWNDKSDCFRELHYLNYAVAAEHQWTAGELRDGAESFAARWVRQFFGARTPAVVSQAFVWLGDLNGHAYRAARHDFRFPRDWDSRVSVAHTLFWGHPVPGSGTDEDRRESAKMVEVGRSLLEQVETASDRVARNGTVVELLAYELRRAIWLFESVLFNASAGTDEAKRLAQDLAQLKQQFATHWQRTNISEGLEAVERRFESLCGSYEKESGELSEWDGLWGPLKRPPTGADPA